MGTTWQSPGTILEHIRTKINGLTPNMPLAPFTEHQTIRYILPGDCHGPTGLAMTHYLSASKPLNNNLPYQIPNLPIVQSVPFCYNNE